MGQGVAASVRRLRSRAVALARAVTHRFACAVLVGLLAMSGSTAAQASDGEAAHMWRAALAQETVRAVQSLILFVAELAEPDRLSVVNDFVNGRVKFADDETVWGVSDYWASPMETFAKGRGDCEDFAIAKYFLLRAAGVPDARLRLVYVLAQFGGPGGPLKGHMVLAHYARPGAEPSILDNFLHEVRPTSRRPDLRPVFSFNSEGLWQGAGDRFAGQAQARLSHWRDVVAKARAEGFE